MKRVAFFIGSRANYASIESVISLANLSPFISPSVVAYASAASSKFGELQSVMLQNGSNVVRSLDTLTLDNSPKAMAESVGLSLLKIPAVLEELRPDVVVTVGDRFETLGVAIATSYMNLPLAHTMGGEITGSIDESVRHAITKLSHIHFPATEGAKQNILRLGEDPSSVFLVGCPRIDLAKKSVDLSNDELLSTLNNYGFGDAIDPFSSFILLSQHPVTSEFLESELQISQTLNALDKLGLPVIVLWPNADAGSDKFSKIIRGWSNNHRTFPRRFFRNLPPKTYLKLMTMCLCLVGNTSSALREGSFLGTPSVNIGTRQSRRESAANVFHVGYDASEIFESVTIQINHGKYSPSYLYGDGTAGEKIVEVLELNHSWPTQKTLHYN